MFIIKTKKKLKKKSSLKKEDNISILKPNQSDINISPIRYQLNQRNNDLISLRRKTKFSFLSTTKSNFKMDFKDETSTHKEKKKKKIKLINFILYFLNKTCIIYTNNEI